MNPKRTDTKELSDKQIITSIFRIYKRFDVPPNLQMHMLRVASVGEILTRSWNEQSIDKENVVAALLVHDLGNIVKFDLDGPNGINLLGTEQKQRVSFWRKVKEEVQSKYGTNDHQATNSMIKELMANRKLRHLVQALGNVEDGKEEILESKDWELKICLYSDLRVSPQGIVNIEYRFKDLIERYKNKPNEWLCRKISAIASELEKEIFNSVTLIPEQINDQIVEPFIIKINKIGQLT